MLSISLVGCAHRPAEITPPPQAVVIRVKDTPPADLTACPVRPTGFPVDAEATMPPAVRAAAIRLAQAYAATVDQLERLIAWTAPAACVSPAAQEPRR